MPEETSKNPEETSEETPVDENPEITKYIAENNILVIERTHETPTTQVETYGLRDLQLEITKINNVIAAWEEKKLPYLAIIAKYNEYKKVEDTESNPEFNL